ncbi:MAG: ABC transporter permease subunit, partial [Deltaproteobacteria bacterium]|nr:ABC transporter permease subunit [Deltaproteobacteria bacterium]
WMFSSILENFLKATSEYERFGGMMGGGNKGPNLAEHFLRPLYGNMNVVLLLVVPFITMRLFAEERKNNTIELLFTAPVTWWDIIIGKFLSAFGFVVLMLAMTLPYCAVLAVATKPDWGVIFTCYFGTICMMAVYIAVGMWASSVTENQIVAGILSFGIILFLWIIKWAAMSASASFADFLGYLSIVEHFEDFSRGVFNSKDLVFYFSATGLWLFFTYKSVESYSWRS